MGEYINKADAIEAVLGDEYDLMRLSELPTIEIVTCEDCKWREEDDGYKCFIREKTGISRLTFFCADGERRSE